MKKIAGLYQSYLRERNDEIQEISTGGECRPVWGME